MRSTEHICGKCSHSKVCLIKSGLQAWLMENVVNFALVNMSSSTDDNPQKFHKLLAENCYYFKEEEE